MACLSISSASLDVKGKARERERGNEKETGVRVRERGGKWCEASFHPWRGWLVDKMQTERRHVFDWTCYNWHCHSKSSKGCMEATGNLTVTAHISARTPPTTAPRWSSSNNQHLFFFQGVSFVAIIYNLYNLTARKQPWLKWYPSHALPNNPKGQFITKVKTTCSVIAAVIKKPKQHVCTFNI